MKKLNDVITKAVMDEDFRKEFLSNPEKAAEGFGLSAEEIAELHAIDLSELTQVNAELEERLSKSFINLPTIDDPDGNKGARGHSSHSSGSAGHNSTSHSSW